MVDMYMSMLEKKMILIAVIYRFKITVMIYFANIFCILFHNMVHGLYNYFCFQDVEDKLIARDPFTIRKHTA